ncbi:MAG: hypothetical protein E7121_00250 [Bacteroidales bacterium]|nr:hypothetical protein [Bacteroidales bacterium]
MKTVILYTCIATAFILTIIAGKIVWMNEFCNEIGSFATEQADILNRRNYLIQKIITSPNQLIAEMPNIVGRQFQGEWALYSASMFSAALTNIAHIYPSTREESIGYIDKLIEIVLSPEIRKYDTEKWGEDPLESLETDNSHISYLSHLAWMISGYKELGGNSKYDSLYSELCKTMNRRILNSYNYNLKTYPGECIYVPDMLVAIVALANYSRQNNNEYTQTVKLWLNDIKEYWIDDYSGLIMSFIPDEGNYYIGNIIRGSYSALSCYYLTFVDEKFAKDQYLKLKEHYYQKSPIAGFKEFQSRKCWLGFDIDAGPIIFNLSPTGTAFAIGPATYFEDYEVRNRLLKTAELAGFSVESSDKRHYLLANIALVGEAITLAMRTAIKWDI